MFELWGLCLWKGRGDPGEIKDLKSCVSMFHFDVWMILTPALSFPGLDRYLVAWQYSKSII